MPNQKLKDEAKFLYNAAKFASNLTPLGLVKTLLTPQTLGG
jgi:hypothetical protein